MKIGNRSDPDWSVKQAPRANGYASVHAELLEDPAVRAAVMRDPVLRNAARTMGVRGPRTQQGQRREGSVRTIFGSVSESQVDSG